MPRWEEACIRDLGAQNGTGIDHDMKKPYDRASHSISLEMKAPLFGLLGQKSVGGTAGIIRQSRIWRLLLRAWRPRKTES